MRQYLPRENGFTLLEVVIVVLIVIILGLILFFMSQQ